MIYVNYTNFFEQNETIDFYKFKEKLRLNLEVVIVNKNANIVLFGHSIGSVFLQYMEQELSEYYYISHIIHSDGEVCNSIVPSGLESSSIIEQKRIIDEKAAQVVKRIFNLKISGAKTSEIAITLNNDNVLTPLLYREKYLPHETVHCNKAGNNIKWTTYQIRKILNDERYMGIYIAGKQKRENMSSKKRINVPKEEWIRIDDVFEPIICREDFALAQSLMQKNAKYHKQKQISSLFASVLTCTHCNRNLKKVRTKNAYYNCCTKEYHRETLCKNIRILERDLEQAVLVALNTQIELMESNKSVLNSKTQKDMIEKSIKECDKELKVLSKKSIYLFEQFADEKLSTEDYKVKKSINDKAIKKNKRKFAESTIRTANVNDTK